MFSSDKYTTWYYKLIDQARSQLRKKGRERAFDTHHIVPTSLGGPDTEDNKVLLTPREHFICHLLLTKMTRGSNRSKMVYAFFRFKPKGRGVTSSSSYERFVRHARLALEGKGNAFYGRRHSEETRSLIRQNHGMRGRGCYDVWVEKYGVEEADRRQAAMLAKRARSLRGALNPMFGSTRTEDQRRAHSDRMSGKGHPGYGKTWMNKADVRIRVTPDQVDDLIKEGWSRGQGPKRTRPRP